MEVGDVVSYYPLSGGGYGNPLERDCECVLDDASGGFATLGGTRSRVGGALREVDNGCGWALDAGANRHVRAQLKPAGRGDRMMDFLLLRPAAAPASSADAGQRTLDINPVTRPAGDGDKDNKDALHFAKLVNLPARANNGRLT